MRFLAGTGLHDRGRRDLDTPDTHHAGHIPEQPGAVDRPDGRRGIPLCRGPAAPISRTDLTSHASGAFDPDRPRPLPAITLGCGPLGPGVFRTVDENRRRYFRWTSARSKRR